MYIISCQTWGKATYKITNMKYVLSLLLLIIAIPTSEQKVEIIQQQKEIEFCSDNNFINYLVPIALEVYKRDSILPSILIAQACLESSYGKSKLTQMSNNLFCIKEFGSGDHVKFKDDEPGLSKFKKYDTFEKSIMDYVKLLKTKRYKSLYSDNCYLSWTDKLKKCGYATSENYTIMLNNIIVKHKLYELDEI